MLKLSRLSDYAVVVLIRLARQQGVMTSIALAAATGIPEPTVAKVLKALQGAGLVSSQRGARGGYRAGAALAQISISRVITAIDGPIAITACADGGEGFCQSEQLCPIRGRWDPVNDAVRATLERISLAELDTGGSPFAAPFAQATSAAPSPRPT